MLSIIIVNYNTRELLRQCLASVRQHMPDAQLIVVDNHSQDQSVAMVETDFPDVICIALPNNVGFARGNNAALPFVTGNIILLLNSDTIIRDDTLMRGVEYLRSHPEVVAWSPRLLGEDGHWQQPAYRWPSLANELRLVCRQKVPPIETTGVVDGWLAGTALMIRRSAWDMVGGRLDDDCFMYWEDCDLSARLHRAGGKLVVGDTGHIVHYGGASGGGADAVRRADLDAWYLYGQYRWYARHRPWFESFALWWLHAFDIGRMLMRGYLRPGREHERTRARTRLVALARRILDLEPPLPGRRQ